jgi:hypothetical protein
MARLLDDQELRATLGKAGRAKVVAEFEIEKNASLLLTIFKTYMQGEARPGRPEPDIPAKEGIIDSYA